MANFLVGELDTGIFNSDSRRAIQDAISAGIQRDTKFAVYPVAPIHMLWHEGGHYTPDPNTTGLTLKAAYSYLSTASLGTTGIYVMTPRS